MNILNRRPSSRQPLLALALATSAALQLVPRTAAADNPSSDKAAAEALFDEARSLMKEGKYAIACPKLVESQRLDPGVGTLLYLASCHEKAGRTATAWVTFREAAVAARRANQPEREKMALARADGLAPNLSRLTIEPSTEEGDPEVTRDGVPIAKALWGTSLPVDPGQHVIDVRLAGHRPRSLTIEVATGQSLNLPIAALERDPAPSTLASASASPSPSPSTARAAPPPTGRPPGASKPALLYAAGGVATSGIVVGTIFGLRAFALASNVEEACPSGRCSASVVEEASDSRTAGNISTVAFVVGAVGLGAAAVLWLTAPSSPRAKAPRALVTF